MMALNIVAEWKTTLGLEMRQEMQNAKGELCQNATNRPCSTMMMMIN